jgi:hypothetical protein
MLLRGPDTRLELKIESGPDPEYGWCRVRVALDTPDGRWSAADPCLTGPELGRLADWLEEAAGGAAAGRLEFLEPELAFDSPAAEPGMLRVELRWKLRPGWARGDTGEPFCVELPAEPGQLRRAAGWLRSELARRSR